jgi:excisionase family DNA binding protein
MQDKLYTVKETAAILHYGERTIRQWVRDGKIKSVRLSYKGIRITQEEIDRLKKGE